MAKNNPKLKLFEGDPLIKVLKKEHYDIVNPFTYIISDNGAGEDPTFEDTFSVVVEDNTSDNQQNADLSTNIQKLDAPNLEDITLVKSEIYYDQKKVPHIRFVFNVKNHIGDEVIGAYGKGG
jgi:predicted ATPase